MKNLFIIIFLCSYSSAILADMDFLNFGNKNFAKDKTEQGKWFFKTGMEYLRYRSTFPEFSGQHEGISKNEEEDVWGYGIYFGRELYFGAGISSSITLGAAYHKTLNKELAKAAEDIDYDVANTRKGHQVLTYEATITLNYLFDNKVVDVQPFIEGGLGVGNARIEKYYQRKPVPDAASAEEYDVVTEEVFTYTKIGIGMNIISFEGFASYFKVSTILTSISERNTKGDSVAYGTTTPVSYDTKKKDLNESASMTTASIGIGYMF